VGKALVITEKPSVARDIVAALRGFQEQDGFWESDEYVVTFSVGHLVELLAPEDIDPAYKRWTLETLPILPEEFSLKQKSGAAERIRTIKKLLKRRDIQRVINACDAGREGELIFREILEFLSVSMPTQRLWLQSMTPEAIREGFRNLDEGEDYDNLGAAAACRSRADWLIGINATRALTRRLQGDPLLGAFVGQAGQRPEDRGVVGDDHPLVAAEGFAEHVPREVDGQQHRLRLPVRRADEQAHVVPFRGVREGRDGLHRLDDAAYLHEGESTRTPRPGVRRDAQDGACHP